MQRVTLSIFLLLSSITLSVNASPIDSDRLAPPSQLACELLTAPHKTVIFDPRPDFSWACDSRENAYSQTAYQIVVQQVSTEDIGRSRIMWDSGKVNSPLSASVEFSGRPLEPNGQYEWQVRVWDGQDQESSWSEKQRFRMASNLSLAKTSKYEVEKIEQTAESIKRLDGDRLLIDFGRAAFGCLKLRLPAEQQPRDLIVHFGEKKSGGLIDRKPGGTIRYYVIRTEVPAGTTELVVRPPRDKRNTTGQAIRLPDSIGIIAPFRYVEVEGIASDLEADDIIRVAVQYPFDNSASFFESSDPTLNAIWDLCKYSIEATTFCGIYVDGDRERIPYEADAYINQLSHYGVDREYALGRFTHEYLLENPTWPTEWKQHSVLMAWEDFMHTGDRESLKQHYKKLKDEKLLLAAELPSGLVDTSSDEYRDIVDWPAGERDEYEMRGVNTVVNAFHYATLCRMAKIASALDFQQDAKLFDQKAKTLKDRINEALWDSSRLAYVDGLGSQHCSLHANLFPLAFGIVPKNRIADAVHFVKSRGMRCSVYASQYLLEGLFEHDQDPYAISLLTSREERSWYNMLGSGSTITLEAWDQKFKSNLDWNHAWGAAPANLIPRYLVGVRPKKPGFERIVIQPRPGSLDSFSSRVPSIRGPIEVDYQNSTNGCNLKIVIPSNCSADVGLPMRDREQQIVVLCEGNSVSFQVMGKHAWIKSIGPGIHEFSVSRSPELAQTFNSTLPSNKDIESSNVQQNQ